MQYKNMKPDMLSAFNKYLAFIASTKNLSLSRLKGLRDDGYFNGLESIFTKSDQLFEVQTFLRAVNVLEPSRTIIFSGSQAEVFTKSDTIYPDSLDYLLPFPHILIQFTKPLVFSLGEHMEVEKGVPYHLHALLLSQIRITKAQYREAKRLISSKHSLSLDFGDSDSVFMNSVFSVGMSPQATRYGIGESIWQSTTSSQWLTGFGEFYEEKLFRNLAIACIGYINCENIELHKEGEVPDKVNRKREREGKKILEPYYVCRIRGVQYDANGEPTGEGTHHGFRYDVRGHFRRLESGKTTWVRPHQRGLQHELYVPKTYVVEKGAKKVTA